MEEQQKPAASVKRWISLTLSHRPGHRGDGHQQSSHSERNWLLDISPSLRRSCSHQEKRPSGRGTFMQNWSVTSWRAATPSVSQKREHMCHRRSCCRATFWPCVPKRIWTNNIRGFFPSSKRSHMTKKTCEITSLAASRCFQVWFRQQKCHQQILLQCLVGYSCNVCYFQLNQDYCSKLKNQHFLKYNHRDCQIF